MEEKPVDKISRLTAVDSEMDKPPNLSSDYGELHLFCFIFIVILPLCERWLQYVRKRQSMRE